MVIDKEITDVRIEKIRANLVDLSNLAKLNYDEFSSKPEHIAATERMLQISIQAMLDLGNHIIAEKGFEEPLEYKDVFIILGKRGIFDKNFVKILTDMVGMRNRLVHVYFEVSPEKLHQFITSELDDFEKFIKIILEYIKSNP